MSHSKENRPAIKSKQKPSLVLTEPVAGQTLYPIIFYFIKSD